MAYRYHPDSPDYRSPWEPQLTGDAGGPAVQLPFSFEVWILGVSLPSPCVFGERLVTTLSQSDLQRRRGAGSRSEVGVGESRYTTGLHPSEAP